MKKVLIIPLILFIAIVGFLTLFFPVFKLPYSVDTFTIRVENVINKNPVQDAKVYYSYALKHSSGTGGGSYEKIKEIELMTDASGYVTVPSLRGWAHKSLLNDSRENVEVVKEGYYADVYFKINDGDRRGWNDRNRGIREDLSHGNEEDLVINLMPVTEDSLK